MYWLATAADQRERAYIRRFSPPYWTVNFPRPMMAAVSATSAASLAVKLVFLKYNDLAGLIWNSVDPYDHPLLSYETRKDYSGVVWSFRWQSDGVKGLDAVNGPTLTIEGRDALGAAKTWYVRLWNYAVGTATDAIITLDFDDLDGGFLLPSEADPVYPRDIDRLFISLVADVYNPSNSAPIEPSPGVFAEHVAELTLSQINVSGSRAMLAIGDGHVKAHDLRLANGYDDVYNVTPARVMRNALYLGYRDWIDHYLGMSHYFSLTWNAGEARFVIDPSKAKLNPAADLWHQDFLAQAKIYGFKVVLSLSYELLDDHAPAAWKQRTHDGGAAQTGWSPPSTLIAPTNSTALSYLRDVWLALAGIQSSLSAAIIFQIGEPWWWHQLTGDQAPCFYDATTTALYTSETANPVPAMHQSIFDTPTPAQQDYLDWLGGKLGASTLWLRDQLKATYPAADVTLLFYAPQVLNPAAPMLLSVNYPVASWVYPAFDFLEIEDYDYVIDGDWPQHAAGLAAIADDLGYGPVDSHYFSGFNLLPNMPQVWANIDQAISDARARDFAEVFVWAYPQILRDGFVYFADQEDEVTGFHEVRFPEAISFGSSGGPRFATTVVETISGHEQRNADWQQARAVYDVGTGLKTESDLFALLAFFRARQGRAYGFRFKDWSDFRSADPGVAPTPTDQAIGVGDGATTAFQLTKRYVSGATVFDRVIRKPVAGTVRVALNGVEAVSGWSVDAATGVITFTTPPAVGVAVTAGFEFDVPVRFRDDSLAISLETFAAGDAPSVGLIEVRL